MSAPRTTRLTLVVGAGRSGTSTAAGVLRRLGLHVPGPEVSSDATNPRGFAEPQWVVDFHDELLVRAGVEVSDARPEAWALAAEVGREPAAVDRLRPWLAAQLAAADHLLVKDPRLLWFIPLWTATARELGAEPSFVTLLRPPAEVVGSKRASYNRGLDDAHGVAAWLNLMLGTELATRGAPRAFVRYHDLLDDWAATTARLGSALDLPAAPETGADTGIAEFVDPSLHRVRLTWDDLELPEHLERTARAAWSLLDGLADDTAPPEAAPAGARLDLLRADYDRDYRWCEAVVRSTVRAARRERPAASTPSVRAAGRQLVDALRRRAAATRRTAAHTRRFTRSP